MADEKNKSDVVGFRLEAEDKDRLKQFMDQEGKGNKEFMQILLNLYELNKGKLKNINLVGDIEELEKYTNKIQQTFINMIGKLEGQKEGIAEEKDKDLLLYKEKVNSLINENDGLKLDNSGIKAMIIKVTSDNKLLNTQFEELQKGTKEKTEQLQQGLQDKITIIEEYKGKNDMLLGQLKQYEKYPEQLEATKELLADAQSRNLETESNLREKNSDITRLTNDIEKLNHKYELEIKQLESTKELLADAQARSLEAESNLREKGSDITKLNNDIEKLNHKYELEIKKVMENNAHEIDRIKEKAEFDKEKALLAKDRSDQELINKINKDNIEKVKELLQENQVHNEKISKLMEESQVKSSEINEQDMKIKELIIQIENKKELSKAKNTVK